MKKELIVKLHGEFEKCAQSADGMEYWLARDLQNLLGYEKWDNFVKVIEKAKTACSNSNQAIEDHFADVGKMIDLAKGAQRNIDDIKLTRSSLNERGGVALFAFIDPHTHLRRGSICYPFCEQVSRRI